MRVKTSIISSVRRLLIPSARWLLVSIGVASLAVIMVAFGLVTGFGRPVFAASPTPAAAPSPGGNADADAGLKAAIQKRFLIPDLSLIQLGPPSPGPFPGTWTRRLTVTIDQHAQDAPIYYDAAQDKVLIGGVFLDTAHPWVRLDVRSLHLNDRATTGPANAPIQVIEFADFECPYCARAFGDIETLVNTTYKGRVRLIFKNFPLNMHPWATQAAIANECVRRQNPAAFWGFARDLYRDQASITPENLRNHIESYAKSLSLDPKALDACILSEGAGSADKQVAQDVDDGQSIHVNSTPTFLINGIPVVGLPSGDVFDFVIQSQLQKREAAR